MSKFINIDTGLPTSTSKWGSGKVNGVSMRNCLRVVSYAGGFVLETHKLFGGGKLWLSKERIVVRETTNKTFLKPKKIKIVSEQNQIILYGKLADVIII